MSAITFKDVVKAEKRARCGGHHTYCTKYKTLTTIKKTLFSKKRIHFEIQTKVYEWRPKTLYGYAISPCYLDPAIIDATMKFPHLTKLLAKLDVLEYVEPTLWKKIQRFLRID